MPYRVVLEDWVTNARRIEEFDNRADFNAKFRFSMGLIVDEGVSAERAYELLEASPLPKPTSKPDQTSN